MSDATVASGRKRWPSPGAIDVPSDLVVPEVLELYPPEHDVTRPSQDRRFPE